MTGLQEEEPKNIDFFSYGLRKGLETTWEIHRLSEFQSIAGADVTVASIDELSPGLLHNEVSHPPSSLAVFENWSVGLSH